MAGQPPYLIDTILPSREVHLVGGPSGAGKTTWLFQTLLDWQEGKDVLGYHSHPVPWVYVSTDRSDEGVKRVLDRMRVDHVKIPFVSTLGLPEDKVSSHIAAANARVPEARLFVIEGMSGLSPENSKSTNGGYTSVRRFLGGLSNLCTKGDFTIIGVVHSPKMKEDSRYSNPRQRVMGSVAWAAYTETIVLIEEAKDSDVSHKDDRSLIVLPRNSSSQFINLRFQSGRLVSWEDELDDVFISEFFRTIGPSGMFTPVQFFDAMAKHMSESTAKRRLSDKEKAGWISLVHRGTYRVNPKQ
jgi:RecA-family ATPase